MAKPRIQLLITGKSGLLLEAFKVNMELELAGKNIYDRLNNWTPTGTARQQVLRVRLNTRSEARAVWDWLNSNLATIATQVTGKATFHICPHDEPEANWYDCVTDPRAEYEEITFG